MRYAILSDVHGNYEALSAVLTGLSRMEVDGYVFLGDAVGYGASTNEVCEPLREKALVSVVGNHDAAVVGRMDYSEYYEAARQALDWSAAQLSPRNREWLSELPYRAKLGDIDLCHGSPFDPEAFDYVFSGEQMLDHLDRLETLAPITFIGHSHLTVCLRIDGDTVVQLTAAHIQCRPESRYIITVGSVGQPRDRNPRACCGIYDSDKREFTYHRFDYDIHSARRRIIDAGLPAVFGDRLLVGI